MEKNERKDARGVFLRLRAFAFNLTIRSITASLLFWGGELSAKVRILTFHCNTPDFIEMQYKTLQKFLVEDFELIVFNDAYSAKDEQEIREMCERYGVQCVRFQQEWHISDPLNDYLIAENKKPTLHENVFAHFFYPPKHIYDAPSVRHCHVIQYALDHFGYDHDDIVVIMDGDAFFTRRVSLRRWLEPYDIVGINKSIPALNIEHFWVIFTAFDPRKVPDVRALKFHIDVINGCMNDTGAHTYHYLKNHPTVKAALCLGQTTWDLWEGVNLEEEGFNEHEAWLINNLPWPHTVEFHMNNNILHYRGVSFGLEGAAEKKEYVKKFLRIRLGEEAYVPPKEYPKLRQQYEIARVTPSDIHEHLGLLRLLAHQCASAVEIGVKGMGSTWGILKGLSEDTSEPRSYLGIDTGPHPAAVLRYAKKVAEECGIAFDVLQVSELNADIGTTDLLFINSFHTYTHLMYELETFSPKVAKFIALPYTNIPSAYFNDPAYLGDYSEFPCLYDPLKRGIWLAMEDFLKRHREWALYERRFNNNGFTVLRRVGQLGLVKK